jgi:hypothetical protein
MSDAKPPWIGVDAEDLVVRRVVQRLGTQGLYPQEVAGYAEASEGPRPVVAFQRRSPRRRPLGRRLDCQSPSFVKRDYSAAHSHARAIPRG